MAMTFTAHDRCDRCGAQASCRAWKGTMELIFCTHHMREVALDMVAQGFKVETPEGVAVPSKVA